jgi:hypothetical protein
LELRARQVLRSGHPGFLHGYDFSNPNGSSIKLPALRDTFSGAVPNRSSSPPREGPSQRRAVPDRNQSPARVGAWPKVPDSGTVGR